MRTIYRAKGHDDAWIEERIKNDLVRNELTDEWQARGAKEGVEYAVLTNEISKGTFGFSVAAYKQYKLLPTQENLRDHMTTIELVLCSLGEATATLYHRTRDSQGFPELKRDATDAGVTAGKARRVIEGDVGQSVVSSENYLHLKQVRGQGKRPGGQLPVSSSTQHTQQRQIREPKRQEQQPSLFDTPLEPDTTAGSASNDE